MRVLDIAGNMPVISSLTPQLSVHACMQQIDK